MEALGAGSASHLGLSNDAGENSDCWAPVTSDRTPGLGFHLVAVGTCGVPAIPLTFKHVHHAEEGEREGGLPTACATTDPNLEREEHTCTQGLGSGGASGASYGAVQGGEVTAYLLVLVFSPASVWSGLGPRFGLVSCSGGSHGDPQAGVGGTCPFCLDLGAAMPVLQGSWGH